MPRASSPPPPPTRSASKSICRMRPRTEAMAALRVAIVDDEQLARQVLREYLSRVADVEVVAECANGFEAVKAVAELRPDLLLLDVQMPKLSGFEVLELVGKDVAVIFTTAYDQYALRAFEVHALDYLLKPFDDVRLDAALDRALPMIRGGEWTQRFVVKSAGRILFLRAEEIDWIAAADNYVQLHAGRASHLVRTTLKAIEQKLDPARFLRVHRSTIVNVESVMQFIPSAHGDCEVVLRDGTRLPVSRTFSDRVRAAARP